MSGKGEQFRGFMKKLGPALADTFRETKPTEEESEKVQKKLDDIKKQEEFALKTYRLLEASGLREFKERLEAKLREAKMDRFNFYFSKLVDGALLFKKLPLVKAVGRYLKNVTFDYFAEQYKSGRQIPIESHLDSKIPLHEESLDDYLSFIAYWIANAIYVEREFGQRAVEDIVKMITDMAGFYAESGAIFRVAQTTFRRGGGAGAALSFLRSVDKNKNALPSLHVEVVANAFSRFRDILQKYAIADEDYSQVKKRLFDRAVKILEACLLIKQHSLRDVPAGLAAVSSRDPNFTRNDAATFMDTMFEKSNYGMDSTTIEEIRSEMKNLYNRLMDDVELDLEKDYTKVLINYINSLNS